MNSYLINPIEFLLSTVVELYLLVLMLRFWLQYTRADFYNPVSQFVLKVTNPVLQPMRRVIPGWGSQDIASLLLALALQMLSLTLLARLRGGSIGVVGLLFWSLGELVNLSINIFVFAIIIQAIMSWVTPYGGNPLDSVLNGLTAPIMRPIRRFVPLIGGLDLSPIAGIFALQFVKMLVVPLLKMIATG